MHNLYKEIRLHLSKVGNVSGKWCQSQGIKTNGTFDQGGDCGCNRLSAVGPAFAVWVMLEKATIAIITMEGMSDEEFRQTVRETIYNAVTDAAGSFGGDSAGQIAEINDIFGLLGLPSYSDGEFQNLPE